MTLIAVTKTYPASDVAALAAARRARPRREPGPGGRAKVGRARGAVESAQLRWHFVGRLQTNKAKQRRRLRARRALGRPRRSWRRALADAAGKQERARSARGVRPGQPRRRPRRGAASPTPIGRPLADAVAATPGAGAARGDGRRADRRRPRRGAFATLAQLSERVRAAHPGADAISAGMSGDLEAAIAQRRDTRACRYGVARP